MMLLGLALTLLCARQAASEPARGLSAVEEALIAGVSDERAAARVRELVALGARMGGTRSGRAAAELRAKWFAEAGLAVERIEDSPTWCHEASGWRLVARASALEGEAQGPERVLERAWPYGFSPGARGSAPLSLTPRAGVVWLSEQHEDGEELAGPPLQLVDGHTTSDGAYPRVEHLRAGDANARAVFGISRPEGRELRDWLAAGRAVTIDYELATTIREARPITVVARLPARADAAPGYLLFCAHGDSDSGGPGANDNASGEAIVLEIAGAWARAIRTGAAPPPGIEVRFAILGKEIHSTRDYLARARGEAPTRRLSQPTLRSSDPAPRPLHPTLAVINFDQAGFGSGADQLNVEPDDLPANRELVLMFAAILRTTAGTPGFPPRWATNKSLGGTDSYVFSRSRTFQDEGRPAVTLFTSAWGEPAEHLRTPGMPGESWSERELVYVDYDLYYHSAGDTPENTTDSEPENMGWCARVGLLGAHRWIATRFD